MQFVHQFHSLHSSLQKKSFYISISMSDKNRSLDNQTLNAKFCAFVEDRFNASPTLLSRFPLSINHLCIYVLNKAQSTLFYKIPIAHSSCFHLKLWSGAESGRHTKSLPWFRGGEGREDISFLFEVFICFAMIVLMTKLNNKHDL